MSDVRERMAEIDEDMLALDGPAFDDAIVGHADCWSPTRHSGAKRLLRVVYSVRRIIEILVAQGMAENDAQDYFNFNVVDAYMGPQTPVYLYDLEG